MHKVKTQRPEELSVKNMLITNFIWLQLKRIKWKICFNKFPEFP